MAEYRTLTTLNCPECDTEIEHEFHAPDPFDPMLDTLEAEGEDTVTCKHCGAEFECRVTNSAGNCSAFLYEHPNHPISCSHAYVSLEEEDPLFYTEHPLETLESALDEIKELLQTARIPRSSENSFRRMVFVQIFSGLEAYLQDATCRLVLFSDKYRLNLITKDKEIRQKKYNLFEIHNEKEIVDREIIKHLKGLIYHNLPRVRATLEAITDSKFVFDHTPLKFLMSATQLRHDCVHRNGKDKDGAETSITMALLKDTMQHTRQLCRSIDHRIFEIEHSWYLDNR